MKIAIVTDSNSGIFERQARKMGVHVVPMPFSVNGEWLYEGVQLTAPDFYKAQAAGADITTSMPSPADVTELWEKLLADHDELVYIPMTSGLSGSCAAAAALAEDYDGRVLVVDDHRITLTLARSIRNAVSLLDQGKTAEEVKAILEGERDASSIYVAVSTLEYLRKSGRVTAAGAAMATILHIKPVLQIQGGKLDAYRKVRGMLHAKKTMIEALRHDLATRFSGMRMAVYSGYSGSDRTVGDTWHDEVQAAFPEYKVPPSVSLPLSICCHTGEGAVGLGCAKVW